MNPKARLGKGLDALLGSGSASFNSSNGELRQVPLDRIRKGRYQPRTHMDQEALQELAASIKSQGIIQPILVRETAGGTYELIAGERRWRAATIAGLEEVPAVVRRVPDEAALAVGLIENIQRENLNPIEEAAGLKRLMDEFNFTHQKAADAVGRSRASVTNLLRLLKLNEIVRNYLELGKIEAGHARAILSLPIEKQVSVADSIIKQKLSVRDTEILVRRILQNKGEKSSKKFKTNRNGDLDRLERELSENLAATVRIETVDNKTGKLSIIFNSLDELDGILSRIKN